MTDQPLHLRITLVGAPAGVLYSLEDDQGPIHPALADGGDLSLDLTVRFDETPKGPRWLGPFARNQGGRRFVYFRVGTSAGQHDSCWSRRGKVWMEDVPLALMRDAAASGRRIEGRFAGTGKDGSPSCATVRPLPPGWGLLPQ